MERLNSRLFFAEYKTLTVIKAHYQKPQKYLQGIINPGKTSLYLVSTLLHHLYPNRCMIT